MSFSLPDPTVPTNGQVLDATPILENFLAIAEALESFDGSQIQDGTITADALDASINPNTIGKETMSDFVYTGCVWSTSASLTTSMTGGTVYVSNASKQFRIAIPAIGSHLFTASKDTYVDVDDLGNFTYPEATNGGSAPALTASSIRIAKVVTSGTAVTSVVQTGVDSNNVQIYPTTPSGFGNWKSWTPTLANITLGNGSVTAIYTQIGKTVFFRILFVMGSTSAMGTAPTFSLPVAGAPQVTSGSSSEPIGQAWIEDTGVRNFQGICTLGSTALTAGFLFLAVSTSVIASQVTSTAPMTWGTGDSFQCVGSYQVA